MDTKNIVRSGLWYRESKNGLKYAYGKIVLDGKVRRCALFVNKSKRSEKSPDFTIILQ